VRTFNSILKKRVLESPPLKWLDFFDDLITQLETPMPYPGSSFLTIDSILKKEFELDGTHMNPAYLPLLEKALQQIVPL